MNKFYISILGLLLAGMMKGQPTIEWQRSLGGTGSDWMTSSLWLQDGRLLCAGRSNSTDGDVTGNNGSYDFWLVMMDTTGQIEWDLSLGGTSSDAANFILADKNGGYLVAGLSRSTDCDVTDHHGSNATTDLWFVKLDPAGTKQWARSLGGTKSDASGSVCQTIDGGFLGCGSTYSNDNDVTGNHDSTGNTTDAWIFKTDSAGNLLWQKCLGGSNNEHGNQLMETPDGGYLLLADVEGTTDGDVIGNTDTAAGAVSVWLVKMDSFLNIQWQKLYGGSGEDNPKCMLRTPDGGFLIGSSTRSNDGDVSGNNGQNNYWLLKIDSLGAIQWQHCYGGSLAENLQSIIPAPGSGYLIGGSALSNDSDVTGNHGQVDLWLIRVDDNGALLWQKCYGGSLSEQTFGLAMSSGGEIAISGYSYSNDADVSGHHGLSNVFDGWVVKLFPLPTGIFTPGSVLKRLEIYPNPASSHASLSFDLDQACNVSIQVFDVLGKEIIPPSQQFLRAGQQLVDLNMPSTLCSPGTYLVKISAGDFLWSGYLCITR